MDLLNGIKSDVQEMLDSSTIVPPVYSTFRKQMAFLCQDLGKHLESIYHLTESLGVSPRASMLIDQCPSEPRDESLSFNSQLAKSETEGMIERLRQMPPEWRLVQITREFDPYEIVLPRPADTSPKLRGFSITNLPCGSQLNSLHPVSAETSWPEDALVDLIQVFLDVRKGLVSKDEPASKIKLARQKASDTAECIIREVGPTAIKQFIVLMLGRLVNKTWEQDIRSRMNRCIDRHGLKDRSRSLVYLLAEGCAHLSDDEINEYLNEALPESCDESLRDELICELSAIRSDYSSLPIAKRHPVLLILDEHLDVIPWESLVVLNRHPYSRVPSIHFAHYLYCLHKDSIKNGLKEVRLKDVCSLINPNKNLPLEKLVKFMEKRFPTWRNIVGTVPTEEELIDLMSTGSVFIYSGHGSPCQFLKTAATQTLDLKNVQLLLGCSSAALKDYGGDNQMGGSILEFALAGSGCTLGMLWAVTTSDADRLTYSLANVWLPGEALDYDTLSVIKDQKKKEPELLRAKIEIRDSVLAFASSAGFIARGLPIKLMY